MKEKRKVPQVKTRGGYRCKPVGPFDVTIKRSVPLRRERESERGRASGSAISAREKVQDPLCRSTLNPRNQTPLTKPFFTARYRCFPLPPPSLKKRYVKLDLGPLSDALFGAAAGLGASIRRTEAFCVGESLFWSFCGSSFKLSRQRISLLTLRNEEKVVLSSVPGKNPRYGTLVVE